jgi:dTMP kinase
MVDEPGRKPDPAVLRGASASTYLNLAKNRGFRNLAASTLVSTVGDWLGFLAIIALVTGMLDHTRWAAFAVSAVMAARVLPSLLLGPVAGMLVDRWDRKRVMITAHIGRGIIMALIPFADVLAILLATLVIETMSAMFGPAKDAVFPTLVKRQELVVANQVNLVSTYGTLPVGGGLYAVLVGFTAATFGTGFLGERPMAVPIWVNAASYLVAALFVARIPMSRKAARQPVAREERAGPWEEFKEGLRFVGSHPVIRNLILGVMVASAVAGVVITAGEFFSRLLNVGPEGYGILVAVVGAGLVVGLLVAAPLTEKVSTERLFGPGIGVAGLGLVVTATMPTMGAAIAPALLMGAGAGVAFIVGYTVLQRRADDRIRGRTFGAFNSGVRAAIFGSTIFSPVLIGLLGRQRRVLTQLPDGTSELLYPYTFDGVRITLLVAGILGVVGAIATGRALHTALRHEELPAKDFDLRTDRVEPAPAEHGMLVVFEGGDGAGKSTQIRLLRAAIEREGRDAVVTREPGGTAIGEGIREVLLSRASDEMADRTEALLYSAARAQHVDEVIAPALEKGAVVLCDRFIDSSIVYQGIARGLGDDQVAELNRWATGGLVPELTVLLDVDPIEGLRRATHGREADRLEAAGADFHRRVREAYRRRAEAEPGRYLVLDATRPVEELHERIRDEVLQRLTAREADRRSTNGEEDEA